MVHQESMPAPAAGAPFRGLLTACAAAAVPGAVLAGWLLLARAHEASAWLAALCGAQGAGRAGGFGHALLMWAAMSAAMMLPCLRPAWPALLRPEHRAAALGMFAGFGAAWMGFALAAAGVEAMLAAVDRGPSNPMTIAAAFALAGAYQFTPLKARALRRMARHDGAAAQLRHDLADLRVGLAYGRACVMANAALMVATAPLGAAHLPSMLAATALMIAERLLGPAAGRRALGALLLGLAAVILVASSRG